MSIVWFDELNTRGKLIWHLTKNMNREIAKANEIEL